MPAHVWKPEDNLEVSDDSFGESVLSSGDTSQLARLPSQFPKPSEPTHSTSGVCGHEILGFSRG